MRRWHAGVALAVAAGAVAGAAAREPATLVTWQSNYEAARASAAAAGKPLLVVFR